MDERFEHFSYAIFEIAKCWHKLASEEMVPYGLKGPHATYLTILLNHPEGLTAPKLCELSGKDKSDVSRTLASLEKKGLVKKEGKDGNLYRGTLTLTEEGKKAAKLVKGRIALAVQIGGEGITEENRKIFYSALDTITSNLQNLCKEGIPANKENK